MLTGQVMVESYAAGTDKLLRRTDWMKNTVLKSAGRGVYVFLDILAGLSSYTGLVTHADIGTDNTAAASTDTALGAPVARAQIGSATRTDDYAALRFFFSDALLPDDTYNELMIYMNGTATLGTGAPLNRVVFGTPLVKATGEDNSILVRITGAV